MSVFSGFMAELPNIIVDNFTGSNCKGTCFFLTHCHSDHMKGLLDEQFVQSLESRPDVYLYCSNISKLILGNYKQLKMIMNKIVGLDIVDLANIFVPADDEEVYPSYNVTVAALTAGHCPGSVMFLYETSRSTILYTGDFRIAIGDLRKYCKLHDGDWVKKIDTVYLDGTFFSPRYAYFPPRSESISIIINATKDWLDTNEKNEITILMPAKYGGERILIEVAKAMKCPIHVDEDVYNMYLHIPEVSCALTDDIVSTRIHSRIKKKRKKQGEDNDHMKFLYPCAISFPCRKQSEVVLRRGNRVNYSSHSSYSEISDFLDYLRPKRLVLCTDIIGMSSSDKTKAISNLTASWKTFPVSDIPTYNLENRKQKLNHPIRIVPVSLTEPDFDFDSPPRTTKPS